METKTNPESLDKVKSQEITGEIKDFVTSLHGQIEQEESERTTWSEHVDKLHRLRFGIRKKKTLPWADCSNLSIPLIDTDISRLKSSYVNVAFGVSPIVSFVPYGPEDVEPMRKREQLFDWRMRTQVDFFKPYCYGIDQILGSTGQTVFRIIWNFQTRRYTHKINLSDLPVDVLGVLFDSRVTDQVLYKIIVDELRVDEDYQENIDAVNKMLSEFRDGKDSFTLDCIETKDNQPDIIACDVKEDLVIPIDTIHIQDARFIDYKYWISKNDLNVKIQDEIFSSDFDSEIDSWTKTSFDGKKLKSTSESDMILLHEVCCWYDINDDGIEERCIVTYPDADHNAILRFIEIPYSHGMFPYVQVKRELVRNTFYSSRGIPSLQADFQEGISTSVNQIVDNGTILNTPERVWRKGILSNPKNRRYIPGEGIEVNGDISQYQTRVVGNATQGVQLQYAQYLKSWADGLIGNQSSNFSAANQSPGGGMQGKMTAKEVDALLSTQNQAQSLDLIIFQQQMSEVYTMIDALYYQYGDEEEEILITREKPQKISRYEIQGKFDIVPNGRIDNATHDQRLKKIMFALQIGAGNPIVKQDVLIKQAFEELGSMFNGAIKSPEEMQQEAQAQARAIQNQKMEQFQYGIASRKMSDDLDVRKEILLTPIQGKKYASD
jgi:hypothetical protein